jgi:aryl-alcohol dehydrogenase-like predicted oxidoreductase
MDAHMDYAHLPGIDKPISRLVFGTGRMTSKKFFLFPSNELKKNCFSILDAVFESGCTAFDTARVYQSGDSERILGDWVKQRNIREKVVIVGKGAHPHLITGRNRLTSKDITADLHASLKTL